MKVTFTDKGLSEYMEWLEADRKKLKKINELIKLAYRIDEHKDLEIISCKGHYGDN